MHQAQCHSSFCCCPTLLKMHENFVKKFKVYPNEIGVLPPLIVCQNQQAQAAAVGHGQQASTSRLADELIQSISAENETAEDNESVHEDDSFNIGLNYKILKHESHTPAPIYEVMAETELNAELAKYGHGPMGRRAALKLLNKIYEATHPEHSNNTPIPHKIARTLARSVKRNQTAADKQRVKRTKATIAKMLSADQKGSDTCVDNGEQKKGGTEAAIQVFLEWIRQPENRNLYNEMLSLNPILIEQLFISFRVEMKQHKISKERLADALDSLGVTYCLRNTVAGKSTLQ